MKRKSSGLGWVILAVVLSVLVALAWTLVRRLRAPAAEESALEESVAAVPVAEHPSVQSTAEPTTSLAFQAFQPLNTTLSQRPPKARNLLMRLEEAEKRKDVELAVTTIEDIRNLPGTPAADIDDSLARRLGALNLEWLFTLRNAQWVKSVKVGRGDSASRIAAENGSTLASLARLNGGKVDKIVIGQKLYVMNHPRFNLVIHRRSRTADLSLNGKFFKRYDLAHEVKARDGTYEMPDKHRIFWTGLGGCFRTEDRPELDMLLPSGSPILVSEM